MSKATSPRLLKTPKRIALIDADSILYATACMSEMKASGQAPDEEALYFQTKDVEQAYAEVVDKLEALVNDVKAEDAIVCITTTQCFRYTLLPSYKGNRVGVRRPPMLQPLQALVQERRPFGVLSVRGLEADDVCGISSGHLQASKGSREPIVVSIDKDMASIPGLLYNPMKSKEGVREVSVAEADRAHLYQTLVGDPTDGYVGCPGVGPKGANRLLDECAHSTIEAQWEWVEQAFKNKGLGRKEALTQARVARILRSTEWNSVTREVHLWGPGSVFPEIVSLDSLAAR